MIKIYDDERNLVLTSNEHNNLYISRDRNEVDMLGFTVAEDVGSFIKLEGYIETSEGTFVVKEKTLSGSYSIVGIMDLEDFDYFVEYEKFERKTLTEIINSLVSRFGWTVVGSGDDRQTVTIQNMSLMEAINECVNLFKYEIKFNNKEKIINVGKELGSDKGVYFHSDLNLKRVEISSDSYDFATRILPVGKDGLTIESVNNGNKFLEDYTYTDKVKTVYWEDNRYTIPENLKATAQEMLDNLSKPLRAFNCEIVDLVNNSKYDFMDFDVGDTITIIDSNSKIKEKHRITSHILYIDERHKGSVRFENKPRDIIDRFTEFDNKFGNYDSKFNDYDYKFDGYDSKFNDYDFKMEDYDFKIDDLYDKFNNFEFDSSLSDRLDFIEDSLGFGGCVIISDLVWDNGAVSTYGFHSCIIIPKEVMYHDGSVEKKGNVTSLTIFSRSEEEDVVERIIVKHNQITSIYRMLFGYKSNNVDLSEFNMENVKEARNAFESSAMESITMPKSNKIEDMFRMFANSEATSIDLSEVNASNCNNFQEMFKNSNAEFIDTSNMEITRGHSTLEYMFENSNASYIDASGIGPIIPYYFEDDTEKMFPMGANLMGIFKGSKAESIDVSNLKSIYIDNMSEAFMNSNAKEIDLSSFYAHFNGIEGTLYSGEKGNFEMIDAFKGAKAEVIYAKDEDSAEVFRRSEVNPDNIPVEIR